MSIFDKIKKQARKLMPKELSGIAQIAAPFVAGGGNPFLAMALSAAGQARAGRGDINPLKVALSGAPGFAYGKGAFFGSDPDKFNYGIGSLSNARAGQLSKPYGVDRGSSLRRLLTGYGTGESDGILNYGNTDFGRATADFLDSSLYGSIDTDFEYGNKKIGDQIIEKTLPDGSIQKISKPMYERMTTKTTMPKAGLFGKGSEAFKLSNLKDSVIVNALTKQGNPFDAASQASKKIKIGQLGDYELLKRGKAKQLSLLKLGSEALTIYSFLDANKQIKTAEEAAAAVEAQMIADGITNQSIIDAATEEAINIFSQLSKADFNLANGGRIGFARGTSEEGIRSLNSGAESITYEGTDGARSPEQTETEQQNLQAMGIPRGLSLEDAIKTFKMSIGRDPKGIEEVLEFFKNRKVSGGQPLPEDPTKPINPFGPKPMKDGITQMAAAGGRMGFMYGSNMGGMGGLSSLQTQPSDVTPPGMELDLRGGGFIPIGKAEKADDVPARVSKNEFVFTADAVKAAGGGSVNEGAKKMYDTMKQLESQVG